MGRNRILFRAAAGVLATALVGWAAPLPRGLVLLAPTSYVGVGIMEVGPDVAHEIGLLDAHGVEISSVASGSPAERGGLEPGDVVVTYRGERVHGIQHFARLVRETPVGNVVELGVMRGRERRSVRVEIAGRDRAATVRGALEDAWRRLGTEPDRAAAAKEAAEDVARSVESAVREQLDELRKLLAEKGICEDCPAIGLPTVRIALTSHGIGAELEGVEGQLARFLGAAEGVLVRHVRDGSPAQEAGLRAGDLILSVGERSVREPRDVARAMRAWDGDGDIPVEVLRDREKTALLLGRGSVARRGPAESASAPD